jgi:hypothetical protein
MFLIYSFMTMGCMFLFHTMLILPRATFCKSNNYCDCATLGYEIVCEGGYIGTSGAGGSVKEPVYKTFVGNTVQMSR